MSIPAAPVEFPAASTSLILPGPAGAIEAAFAWLMANRQYNPEGKLPPQQWDNIPDSELPNIALTDENSRWPSEKRIAASSSFAFGGSNAVLIIG